MDEEIMRERSRYAMRDTFDTLTVLIHEYESDSPQFAALWEARRIVKHETLLRFGDAMWATMIEK